MKRTDARELAVRLVFALSENTGETADSLLDVIKDNGYYKSLSDEDPLFHEYPDKASYEYIERVVRGVYEHAPELDGYIEKHARGRSFSRISRCAVAVMRVAVFETLYMSSEVPERAAINSAVDLARRYDNEETVKYVNGILGSIARTELPEK